MMKKDVILTNFLFLLTIFIALGIIFNLTADNWILSVFSVPLNCGQVTS